MTSQPAIPRLPRASSRSLEIIAFELSNLLDYDGMTPMTFKKPGAGVLEVTIKKSGLPPGDARSGAQRSIERYLTDDGLEYTVRDEPDATRFDVAIRSLNYGFTVRLRVAE